MAGLKPAFSCQDATPVGAAEVHSWRTSAPSACLEQLGVALGGRCRYFCFLLLGRGEGEVRGARMGGFRFLLKIPGGGGPEDPEDVCA